ncbi:hypothetical protein Hanom_Chr16g01458281 [Helianthus anomalus]
MKQIEDNPRKEKSRALAVIQDDEGLKWNDFLPEEDFVGSAFMAHVEPEPVYNRERPLAHRQLKEVVKPTKK